MSLTDRERSIRKRLRDDFGHYASKCLKIRTKAGHIEPLVLNQAQLYLHGRLEAQRERTGKVRALVLKGRQQGISTYIGGRYYWRATHSRGVRVFILTHEQDATNNLFGMVDRYHSHCPELVRPTTGAANAKELSFAALESGYAVGTAGAKAVGRSQTVQLFHGSEVAFWPNAKTHFAGVVQAIPDLPGTEIVLESTANGVGGEFHERWQQAEAGVGDYEAIFIPWFWDPGYRREVPAGFKLDEEEQAYADAHKLSLEQMAWRRAKIAELKDVLLFKQEYPATAEEAFQLTGHDSFIKSERVLAARKQSCEGIGPLVLGVDPARFGDDRFSIAWRRGRQVSKIESRGKIDTVAGANWVKQVIDADNPARVFVDVGGVGAGVVDILHSWGGVYLERVVPINFGSEPQEPVILLPDGTKAAGPKNRRAEMWMRSRDWLDEPGGADVPDTDSLQADACGPGYHYDVNQRLQLESKEHMRARGVRSPDEWDAVVLTFAEPVHEVIERPRERRRVGGWMGA
ncbi:hypothetical protein [Bradyrhizobium arachidis]|uniref:hypothetical protein n=1 Tax=Bradyrhizobium arachidis TaxID=858423 RepID=UPI0021626124|nr:hypothetical protein [Bradyrhizobium arachidis]